MDLNYNAYAHMSELSDEVRNNFYREFSAAMQGRNKKDARQSWDLVPKSDLLAVNRSFSRLGVVRDTEALETLASQVLVNILKLDFNTEIMDHKSYGGWESYEEDWQYFDITRHQYDHYIPYYVQDARGCWRISDYALDKLEPLAVELATPGLKAEYKLSAVNLALQVCHMRSDLASWFVEGGSATLDELKE